MRIQNIEIELPEVMSKEARANFRVTVCDIKEEFSHQALGSSGGVEMKVTVADGFDTVTFDVIEGSPDNIIASISGSPIDFVTEDALKKYIDICDSYSRATRELGPSQIEGIDMARRGLHNDGARKLLDFLQENGHEDLVDFKTARRLFTVLVISYMQSDTSQKAKPEPGQGHDDGMILGKH